jgi:hypothetical protein
MAKSKPGFYASLHIASIIVPFKINYPHFVKVFDLYKFRTTLSKRYYPISFTLVQMHLSHEFPKPYQLIIAVRVFIFFL